MANFGLFPEGFLRPTLVEIRDGLEEDFRDEYGSIPMGEDTFLGFLLGVLAERLSLVWEALEALHASQDPEKASGLALRALGLFTGTLSIAAAASTVAAILCGDDGTIVVAGTQASTLSTETQWLLDEDVELEQLDAWVALTLYEEGDRVTNSSRCYQCIVGGTSDVSGGPTTADSDITDATVHWQYIGEGEAAADGAFSSVETGPITAIAGDLTVIDTPTPGLESVLNLEDAELGSEEQTDEQFRLFREAEIAKPGTGTPPAIKAEILALEGVTACFVFFNSTDSTDADGLPPHSCEILVQGGDDQDIWDTLWQNVPIGITMIGDEVGTTLDDEGELQTIKFSRPEAIDVYVSIFLTKSATSYAGDPAVENAVVTGGDARGIGYDVVASIVSKDAAVTGVTDVTDIRVYTDAIEAGAPWAALTAYSATPGARDVVTNNGRSYICITSGTSAASVGPISTSTDITDGTVHWRFLGATIPITRRQIPDYDTSRTTVTSTDGVP